MKYLLVLLSIVLIFSVCGCTAKQTATGTVQAPTPTTQTEVPDEISTTSTEEPIEYSNEKTAEELITIRYSKAQLSQLEERYNKDPDITFDELSNEFKFECVRYTGSSYYVILMQNDGTKAFLFFKPDMSLKVFSRYTNFLSLHDFNFVKLGETTIDEVMEMDPNYLLLPFSSSTTTAHIVKEGGIFIEYDKKHGAIWVKSIEYLDNDCISQLEEDDITLYSIPYILDIDKD